MYEFDIFEVLAYAMIIAVVATAPLFLLLDYLGEKQVHPIEGDFGDTVVHEGDVVQFFYPRSKEVGTGKVINFYPVANEVMVRVAHLDTPSSNRRVSSVSLDDIKKLLASKSDTEAEEAEIMAL